jgi:hypothetical protein
MKNRLFLLASLLFVVAGLQAQSKSYYIVDGVKYQSTSSNGSWVGETAVFNSSDGSFQVLVKTIPTKNKNYKIKDNANFSYSGLETEASIAMLTNNFEDYYGSVLPNKGKISVKVKNGVVTITVKNAQVCNSENTVCKTVSGQIVLE